MQDTLKSSNTALALPRAVVHWYGKDENVKGRKMGHINVTGNSHVELDTSLRILLELEGIPLSVLTPGATPLVGVIMGSHSDLTTMTAALEALRIFGISYEVDIVSAHRTPINWCSIPVRHLAVDFVSLLLELVVRPTYLEWWQP